MQAMIIAIAVTSQINNNEILPLYVIEPRAAYAIWLFLEYYILHKTMSLEYCEHRHPCVGNLPTGKKEYTILQKCSLHSANKVRKLFWLQVIILQQEK